MQLHGIHHVTSITADAQGAVDFYAGLLGLRLVKKTVNFDAPDAYHLYFGDRAGAPGSIYTFFEFAGAGRGRPGAGMVHRVAWRVGSPESLAWWADRLSAAGVATERDGAELRFDDREGLGHAFVIDGSGESPLTAPADDIPAQHALRGLAGARAYAADPARSDAVLSEVFGFDPSVDGWRLGDAARSAAWAYDIAPGAPGLSGAGTVHHIAWAMADGDAEAWQSAARRAGRASPIMDRTYFRSVYVREPSGVLFELATQGPGFAIDEPSEALGRELRLPAAHEPQRARLERSLRRLQVPA